MTVKPSVLGTFSVQGVLLIFQIHFSLNKGALKKKMGLNPKYFFISSSLDIAWQVFPVHAGQGQGIP